MCKHVGVNSVEGYHAPGRCKIQEDKRVAAVVINPDREALKAIAPYAYSNVPSESRDPYRGCEGRPEDSVEVIFTKQKPMIKDPALQPSKEGQFAAKIQNVYR